MITITINFNGDSITKKFDSENVSTIEILNNSNISGFLGFDSQRVTTYLDGVEYVGQLTDGDTIDIVTKASTKGHDFFYTCGIMASELSEKTGKSFFYHYFQLIENSL
jgi:hypothetical protein